MSLEKPHQSIIVALPPTAVQDHLRVLTDAYRTSVRQSPHQSTLPPHITVVPPFFGGLTAEDAAWLLGHPWTAQVQLTDLGQFYYRVSSTIYVRCVAPELQDMQSTIARRLDRLRLLQEEKHIFHLTVARRVPTSLAPRAMEILSQEYAQPPAFTINGLHLFVRPKPVSNWEPFQPVAQASPST